MSYARRRHIPQPDPRRAARTALRGWVASHGPALGDLTEDDPEEILRTAARHGLRELASREELSGWCTASHARWEVRHAAALTRRGLTGEERLSVAAPPATVEPGAGIPASSARGRPLVPAPGLVTPRGSSPRPITPSRGSSRWK